MDKEKILELVNAGFSARRIAKITGTPRSTIGRFLRKETHKEWWELRDKGTIDKAPKLYDTVNVLVLDIETAPIMFGGWGMWNQNYSLEQIHEDWTIISFSAKWVGDDEVFYYDATDYSELELLQFLWGMLSDAHFVIAHNGRRFDMKKIRARMILNGLKPYSPVRVIDTLEIAKKEFGFTSNKLQYLTSSLCKSHVKSSHGNFAGYLLWKEFLKGNQEAIDEMREYNQIDVLSLEELYFILAPWSSSLPNFDVYTDEELDMSEWVEEDYWYTNLGKYRMYRNVNTGQFKRGRVNLLTTEKRKQLLANIIC